MHLELRQVWQLQVVAFAEERQLVWVVFVVVAVGSAEALPLASVVAVVAVVSAVGVPVVVAVSVGAEVVAVVVGEAFAAVPVGVAFAAVVPVAVVFAEALDHLLQALPVAEEVL